MFKFPYFNYPYNYQYYKYYNNYNNSTPQTVSEQKNSITNSNEISNTIKQNTRSNNQQDDEQAIFEIFGIKLYLDDLIIVGILFFLYQQNVKDEMLYIILFLLLFS